MYARRLATVVSLLLLGLALPAQASAGQDEARPDQQPAASRADVLAGRATPEQTLELMRSSLEIAGGESSSVPESSPPPPPPPNFGGHAYPLLTADLQGDGDEEVVLEEYAPRPHVVVVDEGEVLWRDQLPKKSYLVGALAADLHFLDGEELLFLVYRWKAEKIVLAAAGQHGLLWSMSFPAYYMELNGLVEVDGDEQLEIAISQWSEDTGALSIATLDGSVGFQMSSVRATPERLLNRNLGAQGFVTDGAEGGTDEAVFVTPLAGGFYAERVNLLTGTQVTFNLVPNADPPSLYQGLDYTGDGRRDGFISDYVFGPAQEPTSLFGVFDAGTLTTAWTTPSVSTFFFFGSPYPAGDANGDGGQDLCLDEREYLFDEEDEESYTITHTLRCLVGATGTELWRTERTTTGGPWLQTSTESDIDGDGVIDPVLSVNNFDCDGEDPDSCTFSFEASALNGRDGTALWTTESSQGQYLTYSLTRSELDGSPGDDAITDSYAPDQGVNALFTVWNGRTLEPSWQGAIDTGGRDAYVGSAGEADLDGDGSTEAIVTLTAYEETGEEECYEYPGGEYCYPVYEESPFVAAFEPGGERLWQLEL